MLGETSQVIEVTAHFTTTAQVPKFQRGDVTCPRSHNTERRLKLMTPDESSLFSTVLAASL